MKRSMLFIALALTFKSHAEPTTLTQAVDEMKSNHPDISGAKAKIEEASATKSRAYSDLFPSLDATVSVNRKNDANDPNTALFNGESYNYYSEKLTLTQPLFKIGLISGAVKATDA